MRMNLINNSIFIIFIFAYSLIYRSYIDGLRLVSKGIIDKSEIWQMLYKGRRLTYFKELYFK